MSFLILMSQIPNPKLHSFPLSFWVDHTFPYPFSLFAPLTCHPSSYLHRSFSSLFVPTTNNSNEIPRFSCLRIRPPSLFAQATNESNMSKTTTTTTTTHHSSSSQQQQKCGVSPPYFSSQTLDLTSLTLKWAVFFLIFFCIFRILENSSFIFD